MIPDLKHGIIAATPGNQDITSEPLDAL